MQPKEQEVFTSHLKVFFGTDMGRSIENVAPECENNCDKKELSIQLASCDGETIAAVKTFY